MSTCLRTKLLWVPFLLLSLKLKVILWFFFFMRCKSFVTAAYPPSHGLSHAYIDVNTRRPQSQVFLRIFLKRWLHYFYIGFDILWLTQWNYPSSYSLHHRQRQDINIRLDFDDITSSKVFYYNALLHDVADKLHQDVVKYSEFSICS